MKTQTEIDLANLQDLLMQVHNLAYRLKLDADAMRLVEPVRTQERRIEELEQSSSEAWREYNKLESKLGDLRHQIDDIDAIELYEFVEELGFDPYRLPQSLGERMMLRDRLQGLGIPF